MPEVRITETLTVNEREVTDEERELAHLYNTLLRECLAYARLQMRIGPERTKLSLTRSVVASASRLAALDQKTSNEEHRIAFQSLLSSIRTIEPIPSNVTPLTALTRPAIDQDDEDGDP